MNATPTTLTAQIQAQEALVDDLEAQALEAQAMAAELNTRRQAVLARHRVLVQKAHPARLELAKLWALARADARAAVAEAAQELDQLLDVTQALDVGPAWEDTEADPLSLNYRPPAPGGPRVPIPVRKIPRKR